VFINHGVDSIHLRTIVKHCVVCATEDEYNDAMAAKKKRSRKALWGGACPDRMGLYWCAGASDGKSRMWDMDWKKWYKGEDTDFDGIQSHIEGLIKEKRAERSRRVKVQRRLGFTSLIWVEESQG